MKSIGKNIRKERHKQNLTIAQLAEKSGISDNFLGNIERGLDVPSLKTLVKIANSLSVSSDELLKDELNVLTTDVSVQNKTAFEIYNIVKDFKNKEAETILYLAKEIERLSQNKSR